MAGLVLLPAAFLSDRRYPPAPGWARRFKITQSDKTWAWRYRAAFTAAGLILLIAGVTTLIKGMA